MTKAEIRKKLNTYTKEQIIEGLVSKYFYRNDDIKKLIIAIDCYIEQKRIDDEYNEFERVSNNSIKATNDYINYVKELTEKYGNNFKLSQLTKEEFNKLLKVTAAYEKANKEYHENIENDLKRV